MALPSGKKRGLRTLTHQGTGYYWKVKHDAAKAELEVLIGLEARPSACFRVHLSFVDPSLYGPWLAAAQMQGKDVNRINEPEYIGPKFIVEAIAFANTQNWQEKKKFNVTYKDAIFTV
jgi:hypothetical protein